MGHPQPPNQPPWPEQPGQYGQPGAGYPYQPGAGVPGQPGAPHQPGTSYQPGSPYQPASPYQPGADAPAQPAAGYPGYGGATPPPAGGWPPGPYGQPAAPYGGQPSPYPPPPAGRSGGKVAGIVIAILAGFFLLLDVGGGVLLWTTGVIGGRSPEQTVRDYFEAAQSRDCKRMIDLVTEDTWRQGGAATKSEAVGECEDALSQLGATTWFTLDNVRLVSQSGDRATVEVTTTVTLTPPAGLGSDFPSGPFTSTDQIELRKSGRTWLIDGTGVFNFSDLDLPDLGDFDLDLPGLEPEDFEPGDPQTPPSAVIPFQPDELYSSPVLSYRIELESRTLEGELTRIDVYEHADCASAGLTTTARLALASCVDRTEAAYRGTLDGVGVTQQVLQFTDYDAANTFIETYGDTYLGEVLEFSDPGGFTSGAFGYSDTRIGGAGVFVVVTLLVSVSDSDDVVQQAKDDAHALHAEASTYFLWR